MLDLKYIHTKHKYHSDGITTKRVTEVLEILKKENAGFINLFNDLFPSKFTPVDAIFEWTTETEKKKENVSASFFRSKLPSTNEHPENSILIFNLLGRSANDALKPSFLPESQEDRIKCRDTFKTRLENISHFYSVTFEPSDRGARYEHSDAIVQNALTEGAPYAISALTLDRIKSVMENLDNNTCIPCSAFWHFNQYTKDGFERPYHLHVLLFPIDELSQEVIDRYNEFAEMTGLQKVEKAMEMEEER